MASGCAVGGPALANNIRAMQVLSSLAIGFIPGVGDAYLLLSSLAGQDLITGTKLTQSERELYAGMAAFSLATMIVRAGGAAGQMAGAQLSWDNEGRLTAWQNQLSTPTSQTSDLYDGAGQRVEQQVTSGGATTTVYIGSIDEVTTTGSTTTTTTYYYANGQGIALAVNGTFSYLGSDGLGSAEVALDGSGNVQASMLYYPYGATRYSSGTMPGSYAFTGQRADATTGLDYYNARYYDPVAKQFISTDTVDDGLNRYDYDLGLWRTSAGCWSRVYMGPDRHGHV